MPALSAVENVPRNSLKGGLTIQCYRNSERVISTLHCYPSAVDVADDRASPGLYTKKFLPAPCPSRRRASRFKHLSAHQWPVHVTALHHGRPHCSGAHRGGDRGYAGLDGNRPYINLIPALFKTDPAEPTVDVQFQSHGSCQRQFDPGILG